MPSVPERLATIEGAVERIGDTVDRIDLSLRGNGETGLTTRVDRLEQGQARGRKRVGFWLGCLWQLAMAVTILWLTINMGGCAMATPANKAVITPVSTVDAPVIAEQIENLTQKVSQVQTTLSTQTTNYARDAEQAKTDRQIAAASTNTQNKWFGAMLAVMAAFAVFGWCTERVLKGWRRDVALVAAGGAIACAILIVMLL